MQHNENKLRAIMGFLERAVTNVQRATRGDATGRGSRRENINKSLKNERAEQKEEKKSSPIMYD